MHVSINCRGVPGKIIPSRLLGQNLEVVSRVVNGLMSDRLSNPKFRGPVNPATGLAPGWQSNSPNYFGFRHELTRGLSLSGEESQLLQNYSGNTGGGIVQTGRWVRAGEKLEVVVWALAQHRPVTLKVGIRSLVRGSSAYDAATLEVNAAYWKQYKAWLRAPCNDDQAVFFCNLETEGMVWIDQIHLRAADEGLLRKELFDKIHTLQIPVLRFPGGCISTNYHWRYGIGPDHLRPALPDPVFHEDMSYEFGTDEYLNLCVATNIQPHITINIGSGTPDEAGEWAAYCADWFRKRNLDLPLMYWQMGNEHYGAWELGNMTGDMYADALREYVPAVRANYPKARIIALGVDYGGGLKPEDRPLWRKPVLDKAGDLIDLLALQLYCGTYDEDSRTRHTKVFQRAGEIAGQIQSVITDCRSRGLNINVAMTEWNMWLYGTWYNEKGFIEPYDIQHGLYVSAMLNHYIRLSPDLELAEFYNLVNNMGIFVSKGPCVEETFLAEVFRLYRPAFPGKIVPVSIEAPVLVDDVSTVDAMCLKTDKDAWLFVANRSLDQSAEVTLKGLPKIIDVKMYSGDKPERYFKEISAETADNRFQMPPLAFARVCLDGDN